MRGTTYRDWHPGDGIICSQSGKAPSDLPCGQPVQASVSLQHFRPGGPEVSVTRALCRNHANWSPGPAKIMIQARKMASEKLIAAHWDEYRKYLQEFIDEAVGAFPGGEP